MSDDSAEAANPKELLAVAAGSSYEQSITNAQNRATYIVDKVLANSNVRELGRNNKLSGSQTAIAALAVAMTLEEVDNHNRNYRVAEQGFLATLIGRLFQGSRPVQINVESAESSPAPSTPMSWWGKIGWGGIAVILTISLAFATYSAQKGAGSATAWEATAKAAQAHVDSLQGDLKEANSKRDLYADKLSELQRYIGQLEGQSAVQTDQQKATAQELRKILGKVDDIQKSHQQQSPVDNK
jgi:hypothetical protein